MLPLVLALVACGPAASVEAPKGIQKVVTLLEEMKAQVEKEGAEDTEAYDKYKCWCETSETEKTAAVEAAQKTIAELEAFLEEAAGKTGELKTSIAGLDEEIA